MPSSTESRRNGNKPSNPFRRSIPQRTSSQWPGDTPQMRQGTYYGVQSLPAGTGEQMQHSGLRRSTTDAHCLDTVGSLDATPNHGTASHNEHCLSNAQQSDAFLGIGEWATTTEDPPAEQEPPTICPYHANLLHSIAQAHRAYAGLAQLPRFLVEQPLFIVRHLNGDALASFMSCAYCAEVRD